MNIAVIPNYVASAAKVNTSQSIEQMMQYSIQDEYLAQAEYDLMIKKFGTVRPFINIIQQRENVSA